MKQVIVLLILLATSVGRLAAQEMAVPTSLQLSLFLKILTYERNLKKRADDEVVAGIIYQGKLRKSLRARNELMDSARRASSLEIDDIPVRCVSIDIDVENVAEAVSKHGVDILYVAPLRAVEIGAIGKICSKNHIISLTGVPEYVESGLAVGIGLEDGSPKILINLKSAKKEGADFDSELLNLSHVYE